MAAFPSVELMRGRQTFWISAWLVFRPPALLLLYFVGRATNSLSELAPWLAMLEKAIVMTAVPRIHFFPGGFPYFSASRISSANLSCNSDASSIGIAEPYSTYRQWPYSVADVDSKASANEVEIRQLIMKAYWLSWKHGRRLPVQFDGPVVAHCLSVLLVHEQVTFPQLDKLS